MNLDHFHETIKAFRERVPFRPFTVVLVNGRSHEVDHPDALVLRGGVAVYVSPGGTPVIFDYEGVAEVIGDIKGPVDGPGAGDRTAERG